MPPPEIEPAIAFTNSNMQYKQINYDADNIDNNK